MADPFQPVITLGTLKLEAWSQGELYQSEDASFGRMLGLRDLGASYNVVPPGKSSCPFHNHHVEDEMFVILSGSGTYRFGDGTYAVKAGDVLGAPAGGHEHAHQILNTGTVPLVYLGISTNSATEVVEYPDSGKFLVSSRAARDWAANPLRFIGRSATTLDYWDGEPRAGTVVAGATLPVTSDEGKRVMDDDGKKTPAPEHSGWRGEVGEETAKVRRERGVVDPEVTDEEDDDDPTVPPALRP